MPVVHYPLPPGLSSRQQKSLAAQLACKVCCGSGSGSGSGSGGGISETTPCCGCELPWPSSLTFTVVSSCLGTKTGTMTKFPGGLSIAGCELYGTDPGVETSLGAYLYSESTDGFYDANGFDCATGAPVNKTGLALNTFFSILLRCIKCNVSLFPGPSYRWQLQISWYDYTASTLKEVGWGYWIGDPTCDPIVFPSLSETVLCADSLTAQNLCFGSGYTLEPGTGYTACEGSTLTVDISE